MNREHYLKIALFESFLDFLLCEKELEFPLYHVRQNLILI